MARNAAVCKIKEIIQETPDVKTFRVAFPDSANFNFIAGQFVMLYFNDDPKTRRAYSISSSPLDKGFVDITLNKVGKFTTRMFSLKGGEEICAEGPYGKFLYNESEAKHAVLISGGTGVTPYRCIARYVVQKNIANKVTILYSVRVPQEIIFQKEFEAMSSKHANIKFYATVTRPHLMAPGVAWSGPTGRLNLDVIRAQVSDFFEAVYYLCGSNQLIDDLSRALRGSGVKEGNIRFEKWGEF